MMPQTTGMEIYAELNGIDPAQATRVIFITGGAFTPRARRFLDSVPNKCLEKPLNEQTLRAAVNELVA
jgi:CheY-like chemotaxis protein